MKKTLAVFSASAALFLGGIVAAPAASATECVPSDAWTEEVVVPPVGEQFITVENPDYVPGKDAWTEKIEHPAVPEVGKKWIKNPDYKKPWVETIEHPAVTEVVEEFTRYSYNKGKDDDGDPYTGPFDKEHGWQANNKKYNEEETGVVHKGNGKGSYFVWVVTEKVVVVKEAWVETINHPAEGQPVIKNPDYIPGKDAWVEEKEHPAVPPVGEPTKVVENPDYIPGYTEVVEHPEVTCPTPPTEEPPVTAPPTEEPPVTDTPSATPAPTTSPTPAQTVSEDVVKEETKPVSTEKKSDQLAETGFSANIAAILGSVLILAGISLLFVRRLIKK